MKGQADVTVLVGGHAIDLSCGVRYGMIGEPVAVDEVGDAEAPEEREKELHAYREQAQENLTAFLQGLLQEEQSKRLRQVMLQRDRLFALLGNAEITKELEITDKQRQQFGEVAQEMHKKIEPLVKKAQKGGNPPRGHPGFSWHD